METTSFEVSQVVDENLINKIPLNARDMQKLVVIQPEEPTATTTSFICTGLNPTALASTVYLPGGSDGTP